LNGSAARQDDVVDIAGTDDARVENNRKVTDLMTETGIL